MQESGGVPDVFDPRIYATGIPHDRFRALRDRAPVARQEEPEILGWPAGSGFWAVTRHADVVRVLKDSATYSSCLGATQIRDPDPADLPFIRRMMLNQDPPDHGRLRRLVSRAFTPGRIERFAVTARERARQLLAGAIDAGGEPDLVRAVTDDYALLNLTDLLGVPPGDRGLLHTWTERVIAYQDPDEPPVLDAEGRPVNPRSPAMLAEMFDYAQELAVHKRAHPADDVMTVLATSELADAEMEMFFFLLTVAGNDTVRSAAPAVCSPSPNTRTSRGGCGPARSTRARRSTNSCACTRPCSPSGARPPTTPSSPGRGSGAATRWSSSTPPPTTTSASSPTRTASTSAGPRTRTSPSVTVRTSASAPTSPGFSSGSSTKRYAAPAAAWNSPDRPGASSPTSSTASSRCRFGCGSRSRRTRDIGHQLHHIGAVRLRVDHLQE